MTTMKGYLTPRVEYYVNGEVSLPIDVKRETDSGNSVLLNMVLKSNNGQAALIAENDKDGKKHEEFRRVANIRTRKTKEDFFMHRGKKIRKSPILLDYVASGLIAVPKQAVHDHSLNKTSEFVATYNFMQEDNEVVMFPCDDTIESQEDEFTRLNKALAQPNGPEDENENANPNKGSTSKKE